MVRISTDVEDEGVAHLFLEEATKDRLIPQSLCGEVAMGHFNLAHASDAADDLPVPAEHVDGVADLINRLTVDGNMCQECVEAYRDEVGGLRHLGRRHYRDKHGVDGT